MEASVAGGLAEDGGLVGGELLEAGEELGLGDEVFAAGEVEVGVEVAGLAGEEAAVELDQGGVVQGLGEQAHALAGAGFDQGAAEEGVEQAGGVRRGAAGHDVCFIHPKGEGASPLGGEGVLIELVQAPPDVIAAFDET